MTLQPGSGEIPSRPPLPGEARVDYSLAAPAIDRRNAETVVRQIQDRLAQQGWQGADGSPGMALTQLFGRLTELIIARLNQVPEKHFLAFLNEAGISLLPSQAASTELTFTLPDDYPGFVKVPAGTQVATVQTETQPEVIFETQQDINIVPGVLVKCVAFDPLYASDYTALAKGQAPGPFPAFQGQMERERILYLGDDEVFAFPDDSSRQAATITLDFEFARPGDHVADGWSLKWLYWDVATESWSDLVAAGATRTDNTDDFSEDDELNTVVLSGLPEITETEVQGQTGLWIACQVTGGHARNYLPSFTNIVTSRQVDIAPVVLTADTAFSAIQSGTAFVPLDPAGEFFPLGQHPGRLDTFYLRADEAFTKEGASVTVQIALEGVPAQVTQTTELANLRLDWDYYSVDGWTPLGHSNWNTASTAARLSFNETTEALTTSGSVTFNVPVEGGADPLFAPATVNDQEGYWLRARVTAGSYDEPGGMSGTTVQTWTNPETHQPLITDLKVTYQGYSSSIAARSISRCIGVVDNQGQDHTASLGAAQPFAPFDAIDEGPALYLGFSLAFPAGEWVQILLDVAEEVQSSWDAPALSWEFWSGTGWAALRVSDGTRSFTERGYLGFFGPEGHQSSTEFGQVAYWVRVRLPRPPRGNAGANQTINVSEGADVVALDAAQSQAFDQKDVARYRWRLVSSSPPDADAGSDDDITTGANVASVTLDASASQALGGRPIVRYIWRRLETDEAEDSSGAVATPYLNGVHTNIVSALNSVTVREEALGSSDGKPHQVFTLLRSPVLPGAQIVVREPDRPPANELDQLQWELEQSEGDARALLVDQPTIPGQGVWTRWHQVSDFHFSSPYSRHFTLDPISGEVQFGDGDHGKVPPIGRDNIKALVYRTHGGVNGNVGVGNISVMRNPSGDLANIKVVTNHEATGGGSNQESIAQVKRRGPQAFKHRQRAVTMEDYEWIAREAGGNLARIRCLPTHNPLGLPEAGWVTVVITPENTTDKKPEPTPALLRRVESYLKERSLANLATADQIYVKGPEYIEATVVARVVAVDPQQADVVEIAVLQRLETFLHPLLGGPQREGWELGRDVFISEIYSEIESVTGVDHVAHARLLGTLQQFRICLRREGGRFRQSPFDVPIGAQVGTFDERSRLLLAESLRAGEDVARVSVYGFRVGDTVCIVGSDNSPVRENLTITALSGNTFTFAQSFIQPANWYRRDALLSSDGRLRLPLAPEGHTVNDQSSITGVTVYGFQEGDKLSVVPGGIRPPELEFLPVDSVERCEDRIFVPEGHLVFSGNHDIEMALE